MMLQIGARAIKNKASILSGLILASLCSCPANATVTNSNATATDPYNGMKFYFGDNHTHSGFSGDNKNDDHPSAALLNALNHIHDNISSRPASSTQMVDLGGYFIFLSDHLQYTPTRSDMTHEKFEIMKKETDSTSFDVKGPEYTFTAFPGGELTGLARSGFKYMPWDDKFGHFNLFNVADLSPFIENELTINAKGTVAMDRLAQFPLAIGQFDHSGFNNEPRIGNDEYSLYPYTSDRGRVFKLFEITNGDRSTWNIGAAQYNICLQKGYHVAPVVGSDIHNTKEAFSFQRPDNKTIARTVIIAAATIDKSLETRRKILLDAARDGVVYATESPYMKIKFSINGMFMGYTFLKNSDNWLLRLSINDPNHFSGSEIESIELLQNKVCEDHGKAISDNDVTDEYQCVKVLKRWSSNPKAGEILLPSTTEYATEVNLPTNSLSNLKYIYLKVTQKNGNRSMTSPIYFNF